MEMSSQSHTFFLIKPPLPVSPGLEILGRFSANPHVPTLAFAPSDPGSLKRVLARVENAPIEVEINGFHRRTNDFKGAQVQAQLAGIFGAGRVTDKSAVVTVQSPRGVVRNLQQIHRYFDLLLLDQKILVELVDLLRENRGVAYMAVATLTLRDAELTIEQDITNTVRSTSGDSLPVATQSPVDGGIGRRSQATMEEKFKVEGLSVVGISYMKVTKHRFLGSGEVTLQGKHVSAGKDAVYGNGDNEKKSRGSDRKEYSSADIELAPLSPDVDEKAKSWVSITLDF